MANQFYYLILIVFLHINQVESSSYKCEPLIQHHPCKDVSSSKIIMPNLLSHSNQENSVLELSQLPLNDKCSPQLKPFLCSIYAPSCTTNLTYPIPPCQNLCKLVKRDCHNPGFKWSTELDCNKFPKDGGYCKCIGSSSITIKEETEKYKCVPFNLNFRDRCVDNRNETIMPNFVDNKTPEEALLEMHQFLPLIRVKCSSHLKPLLCSLYFPKCTASGIPQSPCKSLCQLAKNGCEPLMNKFGFSWPEKFNCDKYTEVSCVSPVGDTKVCQDVIPNSICSKFSSKTAFPNFLNQTNQVEAKTEIEKFSALIQINCSPHLKSFVCSIYFPKCDANIPIPPCKFECESVKNGCEEIFNKFGLKWPEILNCDKFSNEKCGENLNIKQKESTLVTLPTGGQLVGSIMKTRNNKYPIFSFRGIPYAEPPIGHLRFRPPVAKQFPASTRFDATKEGAECIQINFFNMLTGSEDCLILNVFTRSINKNQVLKPVMVFIHGGGFKFGSSSTSFYSPTRLLDYDIVLVTINYRLSFLGFLSTMDEASPGNYGLLDQTEALKWVQKNIKVFGGDPNNVNIFGESAGSFSVLFHYLSPLSKGLFHSVIAQSGTPLCPWGEVKEDEAIYWAKRLGDDFGCSITNTSKLIKCLQMMPVEKMVLQIQTYEKYLLSHYRPVKDGYFLPNNTDSLFQYGPIANKVPLVIGATKDEGILTLAIFDLKVQLTDSFLVSVLAYIYNIESNLVTKAAVDLLRNEYYHSVDPSDSHTIREITAKVVSDSCFLVPNYQTIQFLVKHGVKPFVYSFDLFTNQSIAKLLGIHDIQGVTHADDLAFLFNDRFINTQVNQTEDILLRMWTKFAQYKHPTKYISNSVPEWPQSSQDNNIQVYHLNNNFTVEFYNPEDDKRFNLWIREMPKAMEN